MIIMIIFKYCKFKRIYNINSTEPKQSRSLIFFNQAYTSNEELNAADNDVNAIDDVELIVFSKNTPQRDAAYKNALT